LNPKPCQPIKNSTTFTAHLFLIKPFKMNIFVGSLPFRLEETELRDLFEEYGEVSSAKIITDKLTGRSKGFGFVEMSDDAEAQQAIEALNGTEVMGRNIVVNKSEERKDRGERRGGFGGGQGRGGYQGGGNRRSY